MRDYERRLDRLEERYGVTGCICRGTGPGLQIVEVSGRATVVADRCPIHGHERLGHIVMIEMPPGVRIAESAREAQRGGARLPDGRVDARLPGPARVPRG